MKKSRRSSDPQTLELFPGCADPLEIVSVGLARMENYLDGCTEIIKAYQLEDAVPAPGASIEQKVQTLIFDPFEGVPEEENPSWVGQAILDTRVLREAMEGDPKSSDEGIAKYFGEWLPFSDAEAPAWAGKNTSEWLYGLIELFCAALDGFHDGLLFMAEEQNMLRRRWRRASIS